MKVKTIPEDPQPGQRFMRQISAGSSLWEVFDWATTGAAKNPEPYPHLIASMVSTSVARVIVFGPGLVNLAAEVASAAGVDWLEWQLKLADFLIKHFPEAKS